MITVSNPKSTALKSKLFRGFADPSRLSIMEALLPGPLNVSEIVEATGLSQSNVSNHLSCLRDCGLITGEQQGRFVIYRLSDPRVALIINVSGELLGDVAKGIYECTRYEGRSER
jgi:ArsR family transcriptional regulator, cadmium/lead-responsive transcriptional repressor